MRWELEYKIIKFKYVNIILQDVYTEENCFAYVACRSLQSDLSCLTISICVHIWDLYDL